MSEIDPLRAAFSVGLIHLSRGWRRQIDARLAAFGLSEATATALLQVSRTGGALRQGEIAEVLGIEGPSLVRLLDQLCAAGLVERRGDAGDRRAKKVVLTESGAELAGRLETVLAAVRTELLDGVAAEDLAACGRVFRAVGRAIDCRLPEAAPGSAGS